jgi:hypothetical protein
MGVPVISLAGSTFMGRWSGAMLHALGLDDLIAKTPEEYVERAVRLAANPRRLIELRRKLRGMVAGSALCAGARTTRYYERALHAIWRKWCREAASESQPRYSLGSDTEYMAKLRDLVAQGTVNIQLTDLAKLRGLDSPVGVQAETEQWAWGLIIPTGLVWWQFGIIAAVATGLAWIALYLTAGRWLIRRRTFNRVRKALSDGNTWRALWRFGGIRLASTGPDGAQAVAPDDSWIRFVEQAIRPNKGS